MRQSLTISGIRNNFSLCCRELVLNANKHIKNILQLKSSVCLKTFPSERPSSHTKITQAIDTKSSNCTGLLILLHVF